MVYGFSLNDFLKTQQRLREMKGPVQGQTAGASIREEVRLPLNYTFCAMTLGEGGA